jgi:hypothetical protein
VADGREGHQPILVIASSSTCRHQGISEWGWKVRAKWCIVCVDMAHGEEDAVTHLHILQTVLCSNDAEHVLLAAFLHLTGDQQLIEDEVGLLEVEDDVQLAHVAVVFVHLLDIAVDDLEGDQLIVGVVGSGDEEKRGVAAVDDFCVCSGRGQRV